MWLKYGGAPTSTTMVHFRADAQTASGGFASLFVPVQSEAELAGEHFIEAHRLPDGKVRLRVKVNGVECTLHTRTFR